MKKGPAFLLSLILISLPVIFGVAHAAETKGTAAATVVAPEDTATQQPKNYTVTLPFQEMQAVLNALSLANMPYAQTSPVINDLVKQINAADAPKHENTELKTEPVKKELKP